jgi:hypothetical protein
MTSNHPDGFTSRDYDYVNGEQYAPDAPKSERLVFNANVIYFDYTVLPDGPYGDVEVQVEVAGEHNHGLYKPLDFEHVRTFKDAESAQDWVYSFFEDDLGYEQVKEAIKRGD